MKSEKLRKLKATLLLALVLTGNSKNAFADNIEDNLGTLDSIVENVGVPEYADKLKNMLESLPSGVKEYMKIRNLKIVLLEDSNGAEAIYGSGPIRGLTNISKDEDRITIYVEASTHPGYYEQYSNSSNGYTKDEFYYIMARDTLFHELGHFFTRHLFDLNSHFALNDELNDIFYQELNNYCETTHYRVDNLGIYVNVQVPIEYYATAFSCYINYPEELKEYCPRTFAYLDNYIKNINEVYAPIEENTPEEETINIDDSEVLAEQASEPQPKYIYIDNPEPGKPKLLVKTY